MHDLHTWERKFQLAIHLPCPLKYVVVVAVVAAVAVVVVADVVADVVVMVVGANVAIVTRVAHTFLTLCSFRLWVSNALCFFRSYRIHFSKDP